MDDYIYFLRSSFCMGDDVSAPNLERYKYSPESFSIIELQECIEDYFKHIPRYEWDGYCNGLHIAHVICSGDIDDYQVGIELESNWKEMLERQRTIFFDHHGEEHHHFGEEESIHYSKEKVEELFENH